MAAGRKTAPVARQADAARRQAWPVERRPMLKPIVEIYPVMPAKDEAEREALRPIGRDAKIFQEVMAGWTEIIVEADRLGLWGAAAIEHHFWSEGYQMG